MRHISMRPPEGAVDQNVNFSANSTMRGARKVLRMRPKLFGSPMSVAPCCNAKFGWLKR